MYCKNQVQVKRFQNLFDRLFVRSNISKMDTFEKQDFCLRLFAQPNNLERVFDKIQIQVQRFYLHFLSLSQNAHEQKDDRWKLC